MIRKKVIENNIPPTDLTKTIIIVTSNIPNLIGKKMVQQKRKWEREAITQYQQTKVSVKVRVSACASVSVSVSVSVRC